MTIFLKNTTSNQALTLRYGDGLSKMLQINPGAQKELPLALNRGLLQHYLSTFKGALKVIDSNQPESMKGSTDDVTEKNSTKVQVPEEENQKKDGEESNDDQSSNGSDSETGEDNTGKVKPEGEGQDESGTEDQGSDADTSNETGNEGESDSQSSNDAENGNGESEQNKPAPLTEKELSKLSAAEIKNLAVELGIEVTDESTKKGLIPVILNKQGN